MIYLRIFTIICMKSDQKSGFKKVTLEKDERNRKFYVQ